MGVTEVYSFTILMGYIVTASLFTYLNTITDDGIQEINNGNVKIAENG